jgi:hypothetical protein
MSAALPDDVWLHSVQWHGDSARPAGARRLRRRSGLPAQQIFIYHLSTQSSATETVTAERPVREQYAGKSVFCFETGVSHKWRLGPQAPPSPAAQLSVELTNFAINLSSSPPFPHLLRLLHHTLPLLSNPCHFSSRVSRARLRHTPLEPSLPTHPAFMASPGHSVSFWSELFALCGCGSMSSGAADSPRDGCGADYCPRS